MRRIANRLLMAGVLLGYIAVSAANSLVRAPASAPESWRSSAWSAPPGGRCCR
jgi:hypothetical protein